MSRDFVHITADVPAELVRQIDARAKELERSRSFAIRKGLALFLSHYRQKLTETVSHIDEPKSDATEAACER